MTTGGAPIRVRFTRTTRRFPGNSFFSSRSPSTIPNADAIKVDQKDMIRVTRMESTTPTVPKNCENNPFILSIFFSGISKRRLSHRGTLQRESQVSGTASCYVAPTYFCSAFGKNSGSPYSSTPNSPISSCTSGEQIHSMKVLAASLFTSGYFSGFTAMTPY